MNRTLSRPPATSGKAGRRRVLGTRGFEPSASDAPETVRRSQKPSYAVGRTYIHSTSPFRLAPTVLAAWLQAACLQPACVQQVACKINFVMHARNEEETAGAPLLFFLLNVSVPLDRVLRLHSVRNQCVCASRCFGRLSPGRSARRAR